MNWIFFSSFMLRGWSFLEMLWSFQISKIFNWNLSSFIDNVCHKFWITSKFLFHSIRIPNHIYFISDSTNSRFTLIDISRRFANYRFGIREKSHPTEKSQVAWRLWVHNFMIWETSKNWIDENENSIERNT